jgi:TonB family protein
MNRLQKKCLIATTGFHLLLVLTIVFGAAFFTSRPKPDETQLLDVIPPNLIDAALSSGVKNAQPPAPAPPQPVQQPPPTPQPPQPKPPEPKPEPVKQPEPEPVKPPEKLSPDDLKAVEPVEKPPKPAPKKPEISLTPVVRKIPKAAPDTAAADAREAKRLRDQRLKAFQSAARSIKENASSATPVEMPGDSSESYASYASGIKTLYTQAWMPPEDTSSDDANTKVIITIANDGTVISSRIINPSGDARVDASVQQALDRVTSVPPFPPGAKDKERIFKINFNLKAKRMLG